MPSFEILRTHSPASLARARALAHAGVQLLSLAARANLDAAQDDSHSNIGWDPDGGRFQTHPLGTGEGAAIVGLSLSPLRLSLVAGKQNADTLELDGMAVIDAGEWLDLRLTQAGLQPASNATLPYDLPAEVVEVDRFDASDEGEHLAVLASWYGLAQRLIARFASAQSSLRPGPGPVRCWPHHFDIASYVQLEDGDAETARGVGVGMSPGDGSYDQPYFYVTPWPAPEVTALPPAPSPGHWHTEGFVGAIATGDEVLTLDDVSGGTATFVDDAFAISSG